MIRRIIKRTWQIIKEEYQWMKTRIWLKNRAVTWLR